MANMKERIHAAFGPGEFELDKYTLAARLWPYNERPDAWRYATHGGPPGWVRTLGAAMRRYNIHQRYDDRSKVWLVRKPNLS